MHSRSFTSSSSSSSGTRPSKRARSVTSTAANPDVQSNNPSTSRTASTPVALAGDRDVDSQDVFMCAYKSGGRSANPMGGQTIKSRIGVAYYQCIDRTLYFGDFPVNEVERIKQAITPQCIITSTRPGGDQDWNKTLSINQTNMGRPFQVVTLPLSNFSHESSISKLNMTDIEEVSAIQSDSQTTRQSINQSTSDRTLMLASVLDLTNPLSLGAVGALLSYLMQQQVITTPSDSLSTQSANQSAFSICAIKRIQSTNQVYVDSLTRTSLGIFNQDPHPGLTARAKEGHSAFALLNKTRTVSGSRLLRVWLSSPSNCHSVIQNRLRRVEALMQPAVHEAVQEVRIALSNMKDMHRLTRFFAEGCPTADQWRHLNHGIKKLLLIHQIVMSNPRFNNLLKSQFEQVSTQEASQVSQAIDRVIDSENKEQKSPAIRRGIDNQLDALKDQYDNLPSFLSAVSREDLESGAMGDFAAFSLLYVAQIGFLLKVAVQDETNDMPPELTKMFYSEGYTYYKSPRCLELDNAFGDIQGIISDREAGIARALQSRAVGCTTSVIHLAEVVSELDCLISLALAAQEFDLVKPRMTDENVLFVQAGRHLIDERLIHTFIPNETAFESHADGGGELHIVTAPNGGGKSLYIKQVGLIVYLAHCGCFVPAKSAVIGWCDAIYSSLSTTDSSVNDASAWTSEASQVAYIARHATGKSFALIDEFGRSTNERDATALTVGLLNDFKSREGSCPKLLLSTHAHGIFHGDLLQEDDRVRFFTMTFTVNDMPQSAQPTDGLEDADSVLIPFFQLVPGRCEKSFAIVCARQAGMVPSVIQRASSQYQSLVNGTMLESLQPDQEHRNKHHEHLVDTFVELVQYGLENLTDAEISDFLHEIQREEHGDDSELPELESAAAVESEAG